MRTIVAAVSCLLGLYYFFGGLATSAIAYNWDSYKGFAPSGTSRIGFAAHAISTERSQRTYSERAEVSPAYAVLCLLIVLRMPARA